MTPVLESENRLAPAVAGGGGAGHAVTAWIRRHRTWTLLILFFSVGVGLTILAQQSPRSDGLSLSARNAAPEGARAAAEILGSRGVDVRQTDTFDATMSALDRASEDGASESADGPGPTLFLYDRNGYLDPDQLQALQQATDRMVIITPRLSTLSALGGDIRPAGVVPAGWQPWTPAAHWMLPLPPERSRRTPPTCIRPTAFATNPQQAWAGSLPAVTTAG